MGTLRIINALGVTVKLIEGSPYNFNSTIILPGESIIAEVSTEYKKFILNIETPDGSRYRYDLNKDHWFGGKGENHYPNPNSKINIILQGINGNHIVTSYSYATNNPTTICEFASDRKTLDKL